MAFTYCVPEDFDKAEVGQKLYINSRCFDLKRQDGTDAPFVAKPDDIVVVLEKLENSLLVCFYEDTFEEKVERQYGPFVVHPLQIHKF